MGFICGALLVLCFSTQVLGYYGSLFNLNQGFRLINAVLAVASTFFAVTLFYICSAAQCVTQEVIIIVIIIIVIIIIIINVVQKYAEKKLKYTCLCIEIKRIWTLKCTIIPVITGATAIVRRSLRKHLEAIPEKHSIDSLQKTAVLGTSHIIRKVLQCEA
jgi:hypothetical protein